MGSSSLTRGQAQAPCIGSLESQPLDHEGSPWGVPSNNYVLTHSMPHTVLGPRDPGVNKVGKVAMLMELAFSYK